MGIKIEDLSKYHQEKIFSEALNWRMKHHTKILELIKNYKSLNEYLLNPIPPCGSKIFFPEKWSAANWVWFSNLLIDKMKLLKKNNSDSNTEEL